MDNLNIDVLRGTTKVAGLPLISGVFTKRIMADHTLVFNLKTAELLDLHIGDKVVYKGETMKINKPLEPLRSHIFEYVITFEGWRYSLKRWKLSHLGRRKFDFFGTLEEYMAIFLEKLNVFDPGWTVGELEVVEPFALNFDKVDFLTGLSMICQACGCEWDLKEKQFTIKKTIGTAKNYPLAYGMGKGLYSIKRSNYEDRRIANRIYCTGGTDNLPVGYGYEELTLEEPLEDQASIDKYGVWEDDYIDTDIIPQRISSVTAVAQVIEDRWSITDSTINFNLEGLWIDGVESRIIFKTGDLNSQEFKILSYSPATKTIVFECKKDANSKLTPNATIKPEIGDKYSLIGIRMPQSYVTDALNKLRTKGLEVLNKSKVPRVVYQAPLDPLDMKRKEMILAAGDIVPMKDPDLGLDENLRITAVSYPACFPEYLVQGMVFNAEIGQDVSYNWTQKVERDIKQTKEVITQTTKRSYEDDRIQAMRMRQLQGLVFDPDGYFDTGKIKPESIETLMLSVGAKSQNFQLNSVKINVNNNNDPKSVAISAGQLIHLEVKIDGIGYIWNISSAVKNDLQPTKAYYVAAKCSRAELTGTWVISETPIPTESEANYYHFNIGVIFAELDGRRDFSFTNGMTYINGKHITSGLIDAERLNVEEIVVKGGGATVGQLSAAKQQAIDAANAYSEANDELLQVIVEAYADGKVTEEEQARIQDATQKLLEAKQHAEAAANAALQSSKAYTDGLINALGDLAHEDLVEIAKLGETVIQGGYLKTDLIDVIALFAKQITAENLKVSGNSSIGPFSIITEGLYCGSNPSGNINRDQVSIRRDGIHLNFTDLVNGNRFSVIDMYGEPDVLAKMWNNGSTRKKTAHQYDMGADGTAIDIVSGDVRVNGVVASTEKVAFTSGGITRYLNFQKGIFTGVTSS